MIFFLLFQMNKHFGPFTYSAFAIYDSVIQNLVSCTLEYIFSLKYSGPYVMFIFIILFNIQISKCCFCQACSLHIFYLLHRCQLLMWQLSEISCLFWGIIFMRPCMCLYKHTHYTCCVITVSFFQFVYCLHIFKTSSLFFGTCFWNCLIPCSKEYFVCVCVCISVSSCVCVRVSVCVLHWIIWTII